MRGVRTLALIALAACGGGQKPAPPPPPPAPPAPRPACIKPAEEAARITRASGTDKMVSYCIGLSSAECFSLDFATGKLARLATPPTDPPPAGAHVETTNPDLKVCTGADCKTLTPQVWPGAAQLHAATNGSVAVVLLGDAEAGKGYAAIYDVEKTKLVTSIKYAHGDYKCGEVQMLGDTIYLATNVCLGPAGRAALYTTKGKRIAAVGGKDFGTFGNANVHVDGDVWAFLEENGAKIALQDVVKGKVTKTLDVGGLWRTDKADSFGNPGESALVRLGPGKLAVIGGTPANGSVAIVELDTGDVKLVHAPFCQ